MAFTLPQDANGIPYLANLDSNNAAAVPTEQYVAVGNPKIYLPVSAANPLPVSSATSDGGNATLGSKADTAVTDPTLSASEIAVLKGLLKQMQGTGTGATPVSITGSLTNDQTNLAVTANTNIITDYTASGYQKSTLMILANNTGILNLIVDGVLGALNSGTALTAGQWYAFDVPMMSGSKYNLQFSVSATMQIKWIGGI